MYNPEFDIHGNSDIGLRRSENQDHFQVAQLRRQLVVRLTDISENRDKELYGCHEGTLMVIADGMGGHQEGELASRTAVDGSARYVLDMMRWFLKLSPDDEDDFEEELAECLKSIQRKIWSVDGSGTRRMGTTVTMAYLLWPRLFIIHAGDSRCYRLRDGKLRQLTTDHTIAQHYIDSGMMRHEDEALKDWRHVLWNCVGGGEQVVQPEAIRCQLKQGDIVILCSDGLTDMLDDSEITSVLNATHGSKQAVEQLIAQVNRAGGIDNISLIVCRVLQPTECDEGRDSIEDHDGEEGDSWIEQPTTDGG